MTDTTNSTGPRLSLLLRLFIVVGGAFVIWFGSSFVSDVLWAPEMSLPKRMTSAVVIFLVAVPLVVVIRRVLDRRPVSTLGLTRGLTACRDLFYGIATWLIPAAVGLIVALAAGWVQIELDATVGELIGAVVLLIALVFVHEAFPEELLFRGYIYRNLVARVPPWVAIGVQAAIFAAFGATLWVVAQGWEVLGERLLIFLGMGIALGCLRQVSGSVWATVGFHLAFQVVMQLFLSGQYLDINNDAVFTLATAVVALVTVTLVAMLLWRGESNWTEPEPEPLADPST